MNMTWREFVADVERQIVEAGLRPETVTCGDIDAGGCYPWPLVVCSENEISISGAFSRQ